MKINSFITASIITLMSLGVSLPAFAHDGDGSRGAGFFKELGLSQAQISQVKEIHKTNHDAMKAAEQNLRSDRENLKVWMASSVAKDADLTALFTKVQADESTVHQLGFQTMLMIRSILTPTQRSKAVELMAKHHKGSPHSEY